MLGGDIVWKNPMEPIWVSEYAQSPHHRNLGKTKNVEFHIECPLCVGIFALVPGPYSLDQEVNLIADYTIHRLERLVQVGSHPEHLFDKCLIADLVFDGESLAIDEHEGDSLSMFRRPEERLPLGGQPVDQGQVDVNFIKSCLAIRNGQHTLSCTPKESPHLDKIKLIDIKSRTLVSYPSPPCDYLALSYVWGLAHILKVGNDGAITMMPATMEDALALTAMLGKQYLWVDSICINQADEAEKLR